jgi:hypothetical protein
MMMTFSPLTAWPSICARLWIVCSDHETVETNFGEASERILVKVPRAASGMVAQPKIARELRGGEKDSCLRGMHIVTPSPHCVD